MIQNNIKMYCKDRGVKLAELARQIKMSRQRLSRLMNDEGLFTVQILQDIADRLGVHILDLMGFDGSAAAKLNKIRDII